MNPLTRALTAPLRKLGVMRFGSSGQSWSLLPRTQRNYRREVGDGYQSSLIMAACLWMARNFPEAELIEETYDPGEKSWTRADDNVVMDLIARPNPFFTDELMWMATAVEWVTCGNAFWVKVRNGLGLPAQLWYVPSRSITPIAHPTEFISHYEYRPGNGQVIELPVADVIHFRLGVDPLNPVMGISPLASLLREVFTDDEAANFTASLLANLGIPGAIIAPTSLGGSAMDLEIDGQAIKEEYIERFSGDHRGEPMVLTAPVDVRILSWSPQQLDLKALRRIPEERIAAVLGIPAMVLGYGAGLDRNTYANYAEGRTAAYENQIIPTARLWAETLRHSLLAEVTDWRVRRLRWDYSGVRALAEDQSALYTRASMAVEKGWATVFEAREMVGMPADDSHRIYLRSTSVQPVDAETNLPLEAPAPEPVPQLPAPAPAVLPAEPAAPTPEQTVRRALGGHARPVALKAEDRAQFAERWRGLVEDRAPELALSLDRYFNVQATSAALRLVAAGDGATAEDVITPDDDTELELRLRSALADLIPAVDAALDEVLSVEVLRPVGARASITIEDLLRLIGIRIRGINATTRERVARVIATGRQEGVDLFTLADRVQGVVAETYAGRSMTIARTELGWSQNVLAHDRYKGRGVEHVEIMDGAECGWVSHDDPDTANGSVRTLDELLSYPLAHPRCTRVPLPIVER